MSPLRTSRHRCQRTAAGLLVWLLGLSVRAAQMHSESFGTSAAGWTNDGQWAAFGATNGHLQGRFNAILGPPTPQSGKFIATNTASGGAFIGDYDAAGLVLMGFSIYAADVLPSAVLLRWHGGDGFAYFRGGLATNLITTGVWYSLVFSLQDKAAGGWVGSSATNFAAARQAVTRIELQIDRNGATAQHYAVDNFFVDAVPSVTAFSAGALPPHLAIAPLQTNATYHIDASVTPTGAWTSAELLVATNRTMTWPIPDPGAFTTRFFRIAQDERSP